MARRVSSEYKAKRNKVFDAVVSEINDSRYNINFYWSGLNFLCNISL